MKRISNVNIQNFLEENGYYPKFEEYGVCYYKSSRKFYSLLDSYFIRYIAIPNKF